jgi:hypothetical protein
VVTIFLIPSISSAMARDEDGRHPVLAGHNTWLDQSQAKLRPAGFRGPDHLYLGFLRQLAQIRALLETLCAIVQHLHLLERDEAATHQFIKLWEEFRHFSFGIDNLDDDRQIK